VRLGGSMMKKATWATLAAMMWSGAAFAANEENLEVQSTNLTLDFEGRAVLYTVQAASTIVIGQYITADAAEIETAQHDYDRLTTNADFNDGSKAGWRGCSGAGMCIDSSLTGASGAGATGAEQTTVYTDANKAPSPGDWHTEGVVSDEQQQLTAYVQQCDNTFGTCTALNAGSRLIWVHDTDSGESAPLFSGTGGDVDGAFVMFDSAAGSGAVVPAEDGTIAGGPAGSGAFQQVLYDFTNSGEFKVEYDVVVELSVKHQKDGLAKYFKLFQIIWGNDSYDADGADMDGAGTLNVAASN